ncbi:hypothetical protein MKW92_046214 [Papaver armeniacum]|nr:hypothetical protein MKW92_046214 [Papaver armeniacum]
MESTYYYEEPLVDKDWETTIKKVSQSVVKLTIRATRRYDIHEAIPTDGAGFVVDEKRGIILTNRHVAQTGPSFVDAEFSNGKLVPVLPLYVDPVHDFAFFRYYPDEVQSLDCEGIPLVPKAAYLGMEICIVGSLSDNKVSILASLDRKAPLYSNHDYHNDFDIFYMQASAMTESGSSGSPVVDKEGRAIALATGLDTGEDELYALSFLLPLERVVRALSFIQKSNKDSSGIEWEAFTVPRGTLQATFLHKSFLGECIDGLKIEPKQMAKDTLPGVLVVDSVVPDGPAHNQLKVGDVLLKVNGEVITDFLKLETTLDENVDRKIDVVIQRDDILLTFNLMVQNLHSITPNRFLEVTGSVIQPLPYQLARSLNTKCGQVYVTVPGYMLSKAEVPRHSIIKKFANREISNLNDFIIVLSELSCGARVTLEYENLHRRCTETVLVIVDEPEWYPAPLIYTRDDSKGLWTKELALPNKSIYATYNRPSETNLLTSQKSVEENLEIAGHVDNRRGATANTSVVERVIELINPSLVAFEVHFPLKCMVDGMESLYSSGTGVIVNHCESWGLVVIDTVPMSACDVMLSFAAFPLPKRIPGEIVFIHPVHNYALVAYDHSSLGQGSSLARVAELVPEPGLKEGDSVYLVGLSGHSQQAVAKISTVTASKAVIGIATDFGGRFSGVLSDERRSSGVLSDERGFVHAIWGRFTNMKNNLRSCLTTHNGCMLMQHDQGIPMYAVSEVARKITRADGGLLVKGIRRPLPLLRILEVEFYLLALHKAKKFGLSENWVQVLKDKDPIRCQVLCVKGCLAGSQAVHQLRKGDMVLQINGKPVSCHQDVENARQGLDDEGGGSLGMTICRQLPAIRGKKIDVEVTEVMVGTDLRDGSGITRLINWCGYFVLERPRAAHALGGVYVDSWCKGSPAEMFCPSAQKCILEVKGKPTPNLDSFVQVILELEHGQVVRVRAVPLNGTQEEFSIELDHHYWPPWDLTFNSNTGVWRRRQLQS